MIRRSYSSPHRAGEGAVPLDAVHADGDDAERLEAVVVANGGNDDEVRAIAQVVVHALGEGQRVDVLGVEDLMGGGGWHNARPQTRGQALQEPPVYHQENGANWLKSQLKPLVRTRLDGL